MMLAASAGSVDELDVGVLGPDEPVTGPVLDVGVVAFVDVQPTNRTAKAAVSSTFRTAPPGCGMVGRCRPMDIG
jgi:hypothetical protein